MREANESATAESDNNTTQKDGGAPQGAGPGTSPSDTLPPRRRRRAASRPAGPVGSAEAPVVESAPAAEPAAAAPSTDSTARSGEEAAPRRTRRRAGAPAGPPKPKENASAAEESGRKPKAERSGSKEAEEAPASAPEAPARSRRRSSRRAEAPAAAVQESPAQETAPEPEPAAQEPAGESARRRATRKPVSAARGTSRQTEPPEAEASTRKKRKLPPVAVFQPPVFTEPSFQTPQSVAAAAAEDTTQDEADGDDTSSRRRRRRRSDHGDSGGRSGGAAQKRSRDSAPVAPVEADEDGEDGEEEAEAPQEQAGDQGERSPRRRRRGGRRRRRGENGDQGQQDENRESGGHRPSADEPSARKAEQQDEEAPAEDTGRDNADGETDEQEGGEPNGSGSSSSSRRRRRRRRRSGDGGEAPSDADGDDPERTVVKVREPRKKDVTDEVQAIKGSTRLEAKKQRRREGREQGRRRVPIITEAEFLARREAVKREMIVRQSGERTQIGILEDDVLVEHFVNKEQSTSYVGNVYLGKVQNVLPSMEAAFVDIGKGRNAVLYAGEVNFEALGMAHGPRRIETALKSGQSVLVQVTKDPIGHKGARLTSQVSLPGRYLVYVPEGSMTGISRKLPDTERARLKQILKKVVPEDAGVIVRTAAEGASEDELRRDVERLQAQWEEIQQKSQQKSSAPTLLYGEPDMTVRVVRDIFNEDFSKVIVSGEQAWQTIHGYVEHVAPDLTDRLQKWTSDVDVFATYRVDEQLMKALDRKVWLPSGGSLVIDRTEAMIVVDVNTGKFTGQGGNLEETVTRNNLEAAEEIVRQLRLRDLGGIIVIDFIDMVLESNRDLVLRRLLECLGRDRTKHQVAEVTSLGLVQMTRKRVGQGLLESFSEPCVHCNGRGVIVHMDQAPGGSAQAGGGNGNGGGGQGGGKKSRKKGKGGSSGSEEHRHEQEQPGRSEQEHDGRPEQAEEPKALPEPEFVPDEELYSSAAEAEEAASRGGRSRRRRRAEAPQSAPESAAAPEESTDAGASGADGAEGGGRSSRSRRRGGRKVSVPAGAPEARGGEQPAAVESGPAPVVEPEPAREEAAPAEVSEEAAPQEPAAPARPRRRATRKVSAPAGPPAESADAGSIVLPAGGDGAARPQEPAAPAVTEAAEPAAEAAPARSRRRATRKVSAPAGSPAATDADGAVTVVSAAPEEAEKERAPKKTAARKSATKKTAEKKTAAKKAPAKKAAAKKTATKKTAAKKTTAKKAAAKSAPEAEEQSGE